MSAVLALLLALISGMNFGRLLAEWNTINLVAGILCAVLAVVNQVVALTPAIPARKGK